MSQNITVARQRALTLTVGMCQCHCVTAVSSADSVTDLTLHTQHNLSHDKLNS